MYKFLRNYLLIGLVLGLSGCALIGNNPPVAQKKVEEKKVEVKKVENNAVDTQSIRDEDNKVQRTKKRMEIATDLERHVKMQNSFEATINSLATQMLENTKMKTNKPVLFTSFVRLDNLKKTSEFGRLYSESMINELSNRGFNVIEFRGQMNVSINDKGEYYITRDIKKLKDTIEDTYIVVGTYSRQYKKVVLNVRVVDNQNGRILSSSRASYYHGFSQDCVIFKDCRPARSIKIVEEK